MIVQATSGKIDMKDIEAKFMEHVLDLNVPSAAYKSRQATVVEILQKEEQKNEISTTEIGKEELKDYDISRLRIISIGAKWMPDNFSDTCLQCKARFTFFRRRHHCRNW
jgi:hypothetical protein